MTAPRNATKLDTAELADRTAEVNQILEAMRLGLLTADNIAYEDRMTIDRAFAATPIVEIAGSVIRVNGTECLVEGADWCFATAAGDTFGVYSLADHMEIFLEGATFHFWTDDGGRHDYTSLAEYQRDLVAAREAADNAGWYDQPAWAKTSNGVYASWLEEITHGPKMLEAAQT